MRKIKQFFRDLGFQKLPSPPAKRDPFVRSMYDHIMINLSEDRDVRRLIVDNHEAFLSWLNDPTTEYIEFHKYHSIDDRVSIQMTKTIQEGKIISYSIEEIIRRGSKSSQLYFRLSRWS